MDTCGGLRWKGHSEDSTEAERRSAFQRNTVPYSCLRTCQPWGLDGLPAAPELCQPGRSCYQLPFVAEPEAQ